MKERGLGILAMGANGAETAGNAPSQCANAPAREQAPPAVPLPRSFYEPSAKWVAPRLLGHWLLRKTPGGLAGGPIVETEAYLTGDPACHAFAGRTHRNRVMWGAPGHGYVYLIYGFYNCVNAVCRPHGEAEAVLIRAIEPRFGFEWMRRNRAIHDESRLTTGPGKLCVALDIDRSLDGVDLCDPAAAVFIAENPEARAFRRHRGPVVQTTRIGLTRAADWPLRFYLERSRFVSKRARSPLELTRGDQ